jgi:hypothetical protein
VPKDKEVERMQESGLFFESIRVVLYWSSPVLFLLGIVLVLYGNYRQLEDKLGIEIGGIRKRIIPLIETNIYIFHAWLTEKRTIIGLICIVFSMVAFFTLKPK